MKLKCVNSIASTDKKVVTPFTKGKVYSAQALVIGGKVIPNEFEITESERPKRGGGEWIALVRWPMGYVIPGVASFDEVKE